MWLAEPTMRPKDNPSEGCDWLSRRFCLVVRPKDTLKPFDWLSRSNLSIWRGVRLVFSSWTRLIGPSDGIVLLRKLLIGRSVNQLLASSLGFLATWCQTCKRADKKRITWTRLLWATNTPFWSVPDAKTDKTNVTLCYWLYPWWSIYTVHYARWWRSVSVSCCSCVVLMSTCSDIIIS